MAGIKAPLQDLLTRLETLTVTNGDGNTVNLYARIWNNQIRFEADGSLYNFPKPAAFVEVVSPVTFETIGQGYQSADVGFMIHLATECFNEEGTQEQNLLIFDLRDAIRALLTGFRPTGCGPLNVATEQQDYEHTQVYHYILGFVANFTDTTGSKLDANHPDAYVDSTPPTDLILQVSKTAPKNYLIPQ